MRAQILVIPYRGLLQWTYSMISLARASSDGGILMPSAFAVLRLTTSSYPVGAPILVDGIASIGKNQTDVMEEIALEGCGWLQAPTHRHIGRLLALEDVINIVGH